MWNIGSFLSVTCENKVSNINKALNVLTIVDFYCVLQSLF